ncbi:MAG TPA: hypothetical protein VGK60_02460, partial [Pedococcus sp.]
EKAKDKASTTKAARASAGPATGGAAAAKLAVAKAPVDPKDAGGPPAEQDLASVCAAPPQS